MPDANVARSPYLRVFGRLHPDGRLVLRPGYLIDRPRGPQGRDGSPLVAEVLAEDGRLLLRVPLAVRQYCGDGRASPALAVRGVVPLPDAAARILVLRTDRSGREPVTVADLEVPASAPSVRITEAPSGDVAGRQLVTWVAEGDPPPVQYLVSYSHDDGRSWIPVGPRTTAREVVVDVDELPGGERCRVAVLATNGVRSTTAVTEPFVVTTKPCRAVLQQPADGSRSDDGEVVLVGHGWWLEDQRPELEQLAWSSDRDGDLGQGRVLRVQLQPGHHTITLRAGTGARKGEESIELDVGPPPAAS